MKSYRQLKENIPKASKKQVTTPACIGVRKSLNRRRGPHQNFKDPGVLLPSATQESIEQPPRRTESLTKDEILALAAKPDQVIPSTKIKLQLFPINEGTRIGLEKDGYNPFLELTLRPRKKISSVLAHINTKWSSSSVASGNPWLFPFNVHSEISGSGRRWSLQDMSISAEDVYAAVGSPPVFRLRYGWFSTPEPQLMPSTSTASICLESKAMQTGCNAISELTTKQVEDKEEKNLMPASETTDAVETNHIPLAAAVGCVDDCVKMDNGIVQSMTPWSDILTDLSIGGLFSEASLQGKIYRSDVKTSGNRLISQPNSLISDISVGGLPSEVSLQGKVNNSESISLGNKLGIEQAPFQWDDGLTALSIGGLLSEASLQNKINKAEQKSNESKSAMPQSHDSLSILDAEETCHAFSFQKFSSTGKSVRLSGRPNHDSSSNSFPFPNFSQLNKQTALAEDPHYQESKTELLTRSQLHNEDSNNSLGLRGIKWNDSLGPFDLGLSMKRPVSGGDSMSRIV